MDALPVIAMVLSAASAALFLKVGRTVQRRQVSPDARSAHGAFVVWWYALAAVSVAGLVLSLPGLPLDLGLYLAVMVVLLGVLCVALGALMHYLVFLYTSRRGALPYLVAGYALYFVGLVYYILRSQPTGLERGRWGVELEFADSAQGGALYWAVVLLLVVPPLLSALAYLSLYWK